MRSSTQLKIHEDACWQNPFLSLALRYHGYKPGGQLDWEPGLPDATAVLVEKVRLVVEAMRLKIEDKHDYVEDRLDAVYASGPDAQISWPPVHIRSLIFPQFYVDTNGYSKAEFLLDQVARPRKFLRFREIKCNDSIFRYEQNPDGDSAQITFAGKDLKDAKSLKGKTLDSIVNLCAPTAMVIKSAKLAMRPSSRRDNSLELKLRNTMYE